MRLFFSVILSFVIHILFALFLSKKVPVPSPLTLSVSKIPHRFLVYHIKPQSNQPSNMTPPRKIKNLKKNIKNKSLLRKKRIFINKTQNSMNELNELLVKTIDKDNLEKAIDDKSNVISNYLFLINKKVLEGKNYPELARKLRVEGKVEVEILINNLGKILDVKIHKSSHNQLLDTAAITAIEEIREFEKFPSELKRETLRVILPIIYKLSS